MNRIVFLLIGIVWLTAVQCDSENALDCIKTEGDLITASFQVADFNKIRIEDEVRLLVKQGNEQEVTISTGDNLLPDIEVVVEDQTLVIKNTNKCNFVRDYDVVLATVTAVNLEEIRNSSRFEVRSEGVLDFPRMVLLSNTAGTGARGKKSGDFYLALNTANLTISANGVSVFYLTGYATNARLIFSDEQPRLEGAGLLIDNANITQVSANKMIINPQLSLVGEIRGTGNVIAVNQPPIIQVQELFTGRLIFQ